MYLLFHFHALLFLPFSLFYHLLFDILYMAGDR